MQVREMMTSAAAWLAEGRWRWRVCTGEDRDPIGRRKPPRCAWLQGRQVVLGPERRL